MHKTLQIFLIGLGLILSVSAPKAFAQMVYAQGGAYFGAAGCSGGVSIPREIKKVEDDQRRIAKAAREIEKKIPGLERDANKKRKAFGAASAAINDWLKPHVTKGVVVHLTHRNIVDTEQWLDVCQGDGTKKEGVDVTLPWNDYCKCSPGEPNCGSQEALKWAGIANSNLEEFASSACQGNIYIRDDKQDRLNYLTGRNRDAKVKNEIALCQDGIQNYVALEQSAKEAEAVLADAQAQLDMLQQELDDLDDDKEDAVDDWRDRMAEGKTAADFCYTCQYSREVSTTDRVLGITGSLVNAAAAYYGTKYVADQNKEMGWPTSPWMAYGMAYPFVMSGIYGAAYGGGAGAYGCSPSGMPGGTFGYPPGMYGGAGGGMYPGGFPAAGMGMAMGYPAMGYPAMGMAVGGAVGMAMGYPAMGMPAMGMYGGAYMGMPAMGMYGGAYMGMPAMGYPAMGMAVGGAVGMAMGYPAMGMAMGYPAMGMPAMGMAVGGIGGMAVGMPAVGFPASGVYPAAPGYTGFLGGGIGGMYPAGGMPAMGMPAGGSMAAMQYQQQLLQMQQQQMQVWMQEQQRMQQDQMNRQQMVGRLTQELYRIQMQIQQISTGAYGGGYGYGGGSGGYGGVPTGNVYDPNTDGRARGTPPTSGY